MGQKSVYDLGLHEEFVVWESSQSGLNGTRVPGGWIYKNWHADEPSTSTFVPYSDEFDSSAPSSSFSPAQKWLDKSDEHLRLELGELTPDEFALVRSVLKLVALEFEAWEGAA